MLDPVQLLQYETGLLVLNAVVVVKTTNVEIPRYCFEEDGREFFLTACCTCSALIFYHLRPIKFEICDVFILVAVVDARAPIKLVDSVIQKAPVWIWRIPHGKCGRTVFTLELLTY